MPTSIKKLSRLAGLAAFLSLVWQPTSSAQKAERPGVPQAMPETRDLVARETIPFPAPPPLLVVSGMKCDLNGDIYLVYSSAPEAVLSQRDGFLLLPVKKISIGSRAVVQFAIPTIPDFQYSRRNDFDVDGRGRVYALLEASALRGDAKPQSDYLIVKYKHDGTVDSFVKIRGFPDRDLSLPIQPIQLAAFPDGNFLVSGTASGPRGFETFTAVFDRGGTYATDVKLPHDVEPVPLKQEPGTSADSTRQEATAKGSAGGPQKADGQPQSARRARSTGGASMAVSGGFAISAPDGNLYVLRATDPLRLYVVSPTGLVEREFEIASPAPGLDPVQMAMAGNSSLFIQFGPTAKGRPGEDLNAAKLITVFDLNTGSATAIYRLAPSESESNLAACAASPYDFLFVGTSESNQLKVVRYSP